MRCPSDSPLPGHCTALPQFCLGFTLWHVSLLFICLPTDDLLFPGRHKRCLSALHSAGACLVQTCLCAVCRHPPCPVLAGDIMESLAVRPRVEARLCHSPHGGKNHRQGNSYTDTALRYRALRGKLRSQTRGSSTFPKRTQVRPWYQWATGLDCCCPDFASSCADCNLLGCCCSYPLCNTVKQFFSAGRVYDAVSRFPEGSELEAAAVELHRLAWSACPALKGVSESPVVPTHLQVCTAAAQA